MLTDDKLAFFFFFFFFIFFFFFCMCSLFLRRTLIDLFEVVNSSYVHMYENVISFSVGND